MLDVLDNKLKFGCLSPKYVAITCTVRWEAETPVTPCYVVEIVLLKCSSMWRPYAQYAHNDVNVAGLLCMLS